MTLVHVLRTALVAAMASGLLLALPAGINVIAQPAAPSCQGKSVLGKRADGRPAITSCSGEELRSVCADKRLHEHARRESILATVRHVCGGTAMPAATCQGNGIADWLADRHGEPRLAHGARIVEHAVEKALAVVRPIEFGGQDGTAAITRAVMAQIRKS